VDLVSVAPEAGGGCAVPEARALLAPGRRPPFLPATALFDGSGRLVLLQLAVFDPKALEAEAARLVAD
jgi:hypothetical protein